METKMTRRQLIKVAALGSAGAMLSACSVRPASQIVEVTREVEKKVEVLKEIQVTPTPGTVTFQVWGAGIDPKAIETDPKGTGAALVAQRDTILEKYPNTKLVWEDHGWDDVLRQNVLAALLAGNAPDVVIGESYFISYAAQGAILPLDDVLTPEVLADSIAPTHKAGIYQDKHYALAWATTCWYFTQNKDVYKNAGLDAEKFPATWDDVLNASKAITEKGGGKVHGIFLPGPGGATTAGLIWQWSILAAQMGSAFTSTNDPFYPNFNDPKHVAIWELLRGLLPTMPPGKFWEKDYYKFETLAIEGGVGHTFNAGSWPFQVGVDKKANVAYGKIPVLPGGEEATAVVANIMYAALAASKYPDMAKYWVVNTQRPEVQDNIMLTFKRNLMPTTRSGVKKLMETDKQLTVLDQLIADVLLTSPNVGVLPQWKTEPTKMNQTWSDMVTALARTDGKVTDIMDEYQKKAEAILEAAGYTK